MRIRSCGHGAVHPESIQYALDHGVLEPLCRASDRYASFRRSGPLAKVEATGLEPTTSSMPWKRSTKAELRPRNCRPGRWAPIGARMLDRRRWRSRWVRAGSLCDAEALPPGRASSTHARDPHCATSRDREGAVVRRPMSRWLRPEHSLPVVSRCRNVIPYEPRPGGSGSSTTHVAMVTPGALPSGRASYRKGGRLRASRSVHALD